MPPEARRFAKTALAFLVLTFVLGGGILIASNAGVEVPPVLAVEHAHLAGVGFLVNIVIGIALWMLPLDRDRYPETRGRYPPALTTWCWVLLNGGLVVRVIAEPVQRLSAPSSLGLAAVLDAAAVAQIAAIMLFARIAWTRIRPAATDRFGTRA